MVRSMTGFGRAEDLVDGRTISVEIRSVNHRYFEFSCRVPRNCGFLEEKLKSYVMSRVSRGKIDVYVCIEQTACSDVSISVNHASAQEYIRALREIATTYSLPENFSAVTIAGFQDVLTVSRNTMDEDEVWSAVSGVLNKAVDNFIEMRENEGKRLKLDVESRLDTIIDEVAYVEKRSPETVAEYRARLEARIRELIGDRGIDEQRILTETAIFADKIAVAEETVRLRSHISELHDMFSADGAIGRKMDFVVQEMNREANTTGSKCLDVEITKRVVNIKAEIEKIREQIQNIE